MFRLGELVGTAYVPGRSDCWGLVRIAFLRGRGIELPAYNEGAFVGRSVAAGVVSAAFHRERDRAWQPVKIEADCAFAYDYVSLRVISDDDHCGLVTEDGRILTTSDNGLGARLDEWSRWSAGNRICSVWRYVGEGAG